MPTQAGEDLEMTPVERYDALVAAAGLERKGATMPYTSLNGHMFSFLQSDGRFALRLSREDREEFMAEHDASLAEQHGRVLKEYVLVPDELFARTDAILLWLERSRDHVAALKPKPTKRG